MAICLEPEHPERNTKLESSSCLLACFTVAKCPTDPINPVCSAAHSQTKKSWEGAPETVLLDIRRSIFYQKFTWYLLNFLLSPRHTAFLGPPSDAFLRLPAFFAWRKLSPKIKPEIAWHVNGLLTKVEREKSRKKLP